MMRSHIEQIPLGYSDETQEDVFTEIRAVEIAALLEDRRRNGDGQLAELMTRDEFYGFMDREYKQGPRVGVNLSEWHSGWLAHEIVNHEQEHGQ